MEKPSLFPHTHSFLLVLGGLFLLFLLHLGVCYGEYRHWKAKPFYFTSATVLKSGITQKHNHRYGWLKVKTKEGFVTFFSTSQTPPLAGEKIRVVLFFSQLDFFSYLSQRGYLKGRVVEVYPHEKRLKEKIKQYIASYHQNPNIASFYEAIFLAEPLSSSVREAVSALGVSHLVALSGFHLGILWWLFYTLLVKLYTPIQQSLFPYRFALFDVGLIVLVFLALYVWFVGMPPSLMRAYGMLLVGWILYIRGVSFLSFSFLLFVFALLVVLFPALLFSLSFWFSLAGVFYIFLLLEYTASWNKWLLQLLVIPLGIFLLMLPIVHTIFPITTPLQALSWILSLLFIPFYPLALLFHLLGWGGWADDALVWLFTYPTQTHSSTLPMWLGGGYLLLSFIAIHQKWAFKLLLLSAISYALWLFGG